MSQMDIDISIIIVNYNTEGLLKECLRSIYQSQGSTAFEVIVVDNNSSDGSIEMIRSLYQHTKIIENKENRGFARACNQGIRAATGMFLLLLNSDTEVLPDTLRKLKWIADSERHDPRIGIIGCKLLNPDGTLQFSVGRFPTLWSTVKDMLKRREHRKYCLKGYSLPHEVDWITGACMLIDRQVFRDAGLIDEQYFMYYEEVDWCLQARKKGWKAYYHNGAVVVHKNPHARKHHETSENILAEIRRSHLYYFKKNVGYGSFLFIFLATMAFLYMKFLYLQKPFWRRSEHGRDEMKKVKFLLSAVWNAFIALRGGKASV